MLQQTLKLLFEFIKTPTGNWTVLGIICIVILAVLYDRQRQIPGLTVEQIIEDTWFITRDDNRKLAIFISLKLTNKDGGPVRLTNCRLSGYKPKIPPPQLVLQGFDKAIELDAPAYDFFQPNEEHIINPYTEQKMWVYFESGMITMTGMLRTQLVVKNANRKRKALQVTIPRNMAQVLIYREDAYRSI
ncbi:MAG: hypothetical protein QGI86_19305 [Candidatus Poribacteria bacterium]|jgi:hypothetical protein|nr:hypothetical protein [Candidatus Poribacteria bacterium]MDP6747084.1 hypothetical protein [Candidatus Poribacteria bacterium]MDP6998125.1 hypothetical protein [Candidatus Poribacteria bacterium]